MPPDEPITEWLRELRAGDRAAARRLWDVYFAQMVRLARQRLGGAPRRAADEEDVALEAFDSFCRGAEQGRFARLEGRDDLRVLLVVLTTRKALDWRQHERRQKRGGGAVRGESAFAADAGLDQTADSGLPPDFAAEAAEECRRLLDALGDDELRAVALWKLEGCTNPEIAARLGCAPATVERRLRLIRAVWEQEPGR